MSIFKNKLTNMAISILAVFSSMSAMAADGGRAVEKTVSYWTTLGSLVIDLLIVLGFAAGVGYLIYTVVIVIINMNKEGHEKKLELWKPLVAIVLAAILANPASGVLLGSDILTDDSSVELEVDQFKRSDASGG
jgi:hypothetical protein